MGETTLVGGDDQRPITGVRFIKVEDDAGEVFTLVRPARQTTLE